MSLIKLYYPYSFTSHKIFTIILSESVFTCTAWTEYTLILALSHIYMYCLLCRLIAVLNGTTVMNWFLVEFRRYNSQELFSECTVYTQKVQHTIGDLLERTPYAKYGA